MLNESYAEFYPLVLETLESLLNRVMDLFGENDLRQLELRSDSLINHVSVYLPLGEVNLETFLTLIESVVQNNLEILTDDSLELVVQIVRNPNGGGSRKKLSCGLFYLTKSFARK